MNGTSSPSMATSVIVMPKSRKKKLRKRKVEVDPSPGKVVEEEEVTIRDLTLISCEHWTGDEQEEAGMPVVLRTVRNFPSMTCSLVQNLGSLHCLLSFHLLIVSGGF